MPYLKPRLLPGWLAKGKCIPVEMLKAGWAMTYEQAGAEYGQWSKEDFLQMQSEAQSVTSSPQSNVYLRVSGFIVLEPQSVVYGSMEIWKRPPLNINVGTPAVLNKQKQR